MVSLIHEIQIPMGRPVIGLSPLRNASTVNQRHRTKALPEVKTRYSRSGEKVPISPEGEIRLQSLLSWLNHSSRTRSITQGEKKKI